MKKIIFIMLFATVCSVAIAQKGAKGAMVVPDAVENNFKKDFPKAADAKWEKEDGNYEANFKVDNVGMSAV